MKGFIEVLKNEPNGAYDYICNHYHEMSKDELKNIAKELLFAVYDNVSDIEHNKILGDTANELETMYEEN